MEHGQTSVGTGGMICGYCGRPMAAGVVVGGRMYHEECTHGPGWTPPVHVPEGVPISDLLRMRIALTRLWPALERAMSGLVFTADRAGEVQADMNTLRAHIKTPNVGGNRLAPTQEQR